MFKSGGWRRGGPQEWIRQLLAREKGRNFLVKQTSGVSARRSTGLGSVPVARGRRPEESCIARAPVCPSVRPAYRGVRACRHFVQVLHQRLRAASTHVLRFVRAESFARGPPRSTLRSGFLKEDDEESICIGSVPPWWMPSRRFISQLRQRAGAGIAPVNPAAAVMWFLPLPPFRIRAGGVSPLRQEEREVAQPGYGKEEQESVRACSRLETSGDGGGTHLTAPSPPSSSSEAMRGETRETWPDANGKRQGSAPSVSTSVRRVALPCQTDGRTAELILVS